MADIQTFQEIYEAVMLAIGDKNYSRAVEVKAVVNMIYLNEVCQCDELYPLFWLYELDDSKASKAPVTNVTGITKATPPVVAAIAHKFVTGDIVTSYDVTGMAELESRTCHVTRLSADTFSLQDLTKTDIAGLGFVSAGTAGKFHHRGVLLSSCKEIIAANFHGYEGMDPIGPEEIANDTTWMDVSTSSPSRYFHRKVFTGASQYDYILWHLAASAAVQLHVQYEKQPARLSGETDYLLGPPQVGDATIAGSVMRLGVNSVQVEAGVVWPSIYQSNIQAIKTMNRKWWEKFRASGRSEPYLS